MKDFVHETGFPKFGAAVRGGCSKIWDSGLDPKFQNPERQVKCVVPNSGTRCSKFWEKFYFSERFYIFKLFRPVPNSGNAVSKIWEGVFQNLGLRFGAAIPKSGTAGWTCNSKIRGSRSTLSFQNLKLRFGVAVPKSGTAGWSRNSKIWGSRSMLPFQILGRALF